MNIEYDNELNTRIAPRFFASQQLMPLFDRRPVATKYTFFQTVDETPVSNTDTLNYNQYSTETVFNPGSRGQVDFYMKEIDTESLLRHQFMALQKSNQSVYVPELNSSLYDCPMAYNKEHYPHSKTDCKTKEQCQNLAPNTFYNSTRINIRN